MQKEMIANLQEKNMLLANISTTIKSLKDVVEKVSDCEKEKAELENEIKLKIAEKEAALSSTEHQHIETAKIKIDAYSGVHKGGPGGALDPPIYFEKC